MPQKQSNAGCCGRVRHKLGTNYYRYCIGAFVHNLSGFFYWV